MSLSIFQFEAESVRVVSRDGETWFVAADAARVLGISQVASTIRNFPEDEKGVHTMHISSEGRPGHRSTQNMTVLNEPGLYRLIFQSRKAEAERFKKWVFTEVLPALRVTGQYSVNRVEGEVQRMRGVMEGAVQAVVSGAMTVEKGSVVAKLAAQWAKTLPREWQQGLALPPPQATAAQWERVAAAVVARAAESDAAWALCRRDAAGAVCEVKVRTGRMVDVVDAGNLLPGLLTGDYAQRCSRLGLLVRAGMLGRTWALPDGSQWRVESWRAKMARGWAFTRIS